VSKKNSVDDVEIRSKEALARHIWDTLRSIKIGEDQIERIKKGNTAIPYLKWSTAYLLLKKNFPCSMFSFTLFDNGRDGIKDEYCLLPDGTAYIEANLEILKQGQSFFASMHLPIYGTGHRAVKGFDSAQLSNNKMRCKVKLLATIGLGIDIYGAKDHTIEDFERLDPVEYGIKSGLFKKDRGFRKTHMDKFFELCVSQWNLNPKNEKVKDVQQIIDMGESSMQAMLVHITSTTPDLGQYKLIKQGDSNE